MLDIINKSNEQYLKLKLKIQTKSWHSEKRFQDKNLTKNLWIKI